MAFYALRNCCAFGVYYKRGEQFRGDDKDAPRNFFGERGEIREKKIFPEGKKITKKKAPELDF